MFAHLKIFYSFQSVELDFKIITNLKIFPFSTERYKIIFTSFFMQTLPDSMFISLAACSTSYIQVLNTQSSTNLQCTYRIMHTKVFPQGIMHTEK